ALQRLRTTEGEAAPARFEGAFLAALAALRATCFAQANMHIYISVRASRWLGDIQVNSPVLPAEEALQLREELLQARAQGWEPFRKAWVQLLQVVSWSTHPYSGCGASLGWASVSPGGGEADLSAATVRSVVGARSPAASRNDVPQFLGPARCCPRMWKTAASWHAFSCTVLAFLCPGLDMRLRPFTLLPLESVMLLITVVLLPPVMLLTMRCWASVLSLAVMLLESLVVLRMLMLESTVALLESVVLLTDAMLGSVVLLTMVVFESVLLPAVVLLHSVLLLTMVLLKSSTLLAVVLLESVMLLKMVWLGSAVLLTDEVLGFVVLLTMVLLESVLLLAVLQLGSMVLLAMMPLKSAMLLTVVMLESVVPLTMVLLESVMLLAILLLESVVPLTLLLLLEPTIAYGRTAVSCCWSPSWYSGC
ncbi:unnamed protein product, partial [Prorocentrum cordatum]